YNQQLADDNNRLTSVKDSVRTLGICRKINKTLTQKQKVIALIRLLEMVMSEATVSSQAMEIITTVATVFNIDPSEYRLIELFVQSDGSEESSDLRVIQTLPSTEADRPGENRLIFLAIRSVSTYFVKYIGRESNVLNGFIMQP